MIPRSLADSLSGRQLGQVVAMMEAAYLDGFVAAGGDVLDTVSHHEQFRRTLAARIETMLWQSGLVMRYLRPPPALRCTRRGHPESVQPARR